MQRDTEEVIWTAVRRPGLELLKFTFKTDQRFSLREEKIQSNGENGAAGKLNAVPLLWKSET